MSGLDLAGQLDDIKMRLAEYKLAELRIIQKGESYSIGDRSLDRGDLEFIASQIDKLQKQCDRLTNGSGGMTVNYGLPRNT